MTPGGSEGHPGWHGPRGRAALRYQHGPKWWPRSLESVWSSMAAAAMNNNTDPSCSRATTQLESINQGQPRQRDRSHQEQEEETGKQLCFFLLSLQSGLPLVCVTLCEKTFTLSQPFQETCSHRLTEAWLLVNSSPQLTIKSKHQMCHFVVD